MSDRVKEPKQLQDNFKNFFGQARRIGTLRQLITEKTRQIPGSMSAVSLANINADIVLALTKMGIYLERDKANLARMTMAEQNERLQAAFDRAIENCCIYPLLFSKRELVASGGKLVISDRPEWEGWRENKRATAMKEMSPMRSIGSRDMSALVRILGNHSLWAPFRMGRYSVTESALIQGASVRHKADVPEMETLTMRLLTFCTMLDSLGTTYPGAFWALTSIPAKHNGDNIHLPIPPARSAVLAIQPLGAFQIDLPQDIDDSRNETGEPEMKSAGYVGNKNRRAIPVIMVRYATSLPGLGTAKAVKSLVDHCGMPTQDAGNAYMTPVQHSLLSRLLHSNSRRLASSEIKQYQEKVPKYIRKETGISFISPIYCPSNDIADRIEIGRKHQLSCAVCREEDVKLFYCSACSGIAYCSAEHQSADWASHKVECRSSHVNKQSQAHCEDPSDPLSRIVKVTLPLQPSMSGIGFGSGFVNYENPMERVKPPSKSSKRSQCPKTIYAHGERFLVRVRWGGHADTMFGVKEEERASLNGPFRAPDPKFQGILDLHMSVLHVVDRPASFGILLQKKTGLVRSTCVVSVGNQPLLSEDNTVIFDAMVEIIKRSKEGKAECGYFWARRKGDCIEVYLDDIPDQGLGW
ncbi:hypothetical protein Hypma_002777 [Hypsizygus marmoreus]|uniref:MYND-type domain-containing protein n=1 Tax=Hypsizygus marmoreus TaxID=39966 RepID=A0A369J5H1_HYPMA|nr:hypothetical protein Hypma_002777 [Hypsizygus marmoreus]